MPSIKRIRASDETGNASQPTVTVLRSPGATSLTVDTVAGIYAGSEGFYASMGTPHTFTDPITGETLTVISEATAVDFRGHIDTGHIIIDEIAPGYTDTNGSKVGDIVVIRPTTQWADNASDVLAAGALNDDGTPAVTVLNPTGAIIPYAGRTAPTGWLLCDGSAVSRSTYADLFNLLNPSLGTVTVTIASPGVFTFNSHGLSTGSGVYLTTTGSLPTGLTANTQYWVIKIDADTFKLATSLANALAGTAINTSGTQSGTHTLTHCAFGVGNGSTTFNVPDTRGRVLTGKNTATFAALGMTGGEETHVLTATEMPSHTHAPINFAGKNIGPHNSNSGTGKWGFSYSSTTSYDGDMSTGSAGSDGAHNNLQPYLTINHLIKT